MNWTRWLPLRFILRRAAHSQGFLDPIELLARLRSFAQPSEVGEPVELLRAGAIFHARGLINSKIIQHNLDWVWPYWIVRQYDPSDDSFLPRAFSLSHINLTNRNWTAVGYPDCDELPLVDPRGMLTPFFDGWSLDCWLLTHDGKTLIPSKTMCCDQTQTMGDTLSIRTSTQQEDLAITTEASVELQHGKPVCRLSITSGSKNPAWLALTLRPLNPEGISFIDKVSLSKDRRQWTVDGEQRIEFSSPAAHHFVSDYGQGDVFGLLQRFQRSHSNGDKHDNSHTAPVEQTEGRCDVGLVTAAALFPLDSNGASQLSVSVPLQKTPNSALQEQAWIKEYEGACQLRCPEQRYQLLYDAAVTSLVLHSPHDVFPGPYTYKRFWFRDAAFIIHALLCVNMSDRAERALKKFPPRQTTMGYFRSQEGEWDANGEVLWILHRYELLTGKQLAETWLHSIQRGARWISRKRLPQVIDSPHAGLLPPGFSAEHLGLNDYYYWDDFWGEAGLRAAVELLANRDPETSITCWQEAENFAAAIERSLQSCEQRLGRPAMPASPYRRLDAGAIGSLAVGYPLQNCAADDRRLLDSVEYLLDNCFVNNAFFQDMIHSGLNAYLTLEVAQVLLRAGDPRYLTLIDEVADLATSTGQWPEAIHPRTGGGCMGDGHHVWASAEWVLMIRNCFVREEGSRLLLCAGVPERWLDQEESISFGPAPTEFGAVTITLSSRSISEVLITWDAQWRVRPEILEIRLPGFKPQSVQAGESVAILFRERTTL